MGTGRKVPTRATATIPKTLASNSIGPAGNISARVAPSSAATNISGKVMAIILAKFFKNSVRADTADSRFGSSHAVCGSVFGTIHGTSASSTITVASFVMAIPRGKRLNTIASTTTFNVGELIIVASTVFG